MSTIHMGTDDGTVPWCGSHTGPTTPIDKPSTRAWCPACIKVFRRLYPRQPLPPTLQPCTPGTPLVDCTGAGSYPCHDPHRTQDR